jgi:hypothetical protein
MKMRKKRLSQVCPFGLLLLFLLSGTALAQKFSVTGKVSDSKSNLEFNQI